MSILRRVGEERLTGAKRDVISSISEPECQNAKNVRDWDDDDDDDDADEGIEFHREPCFSTG